jgi:hypothetical protein
MPTRSAAPTIRLMRRLASGGLTYPFQSATLAGIWRWLQTAKVQRPFIGYYIDRGGEPGTIRKRPRSGWADPVRRGPPHPHRLIGPPAVCPFCHMVEDCRRGHCPHTHWKGCHD